jgi:hypothetical protein
MTKSRLFFSVLVLIGAIQTPTWAQGNLLPEGSQDYDLVERMLVLHGQTDSLNLAIKPWRRADIGSLTSGWIANQGDEWQVRVLAEDHFLWLPKVKSRVVPTVQKDTTNGLFKEYRTTVNPQNEINWRPAPNSKPIFGLFYKHRAAALEVNKEELKLTVNPLLRFSYGRDPKESEAAFINTRGVYVQGLIDDRVSFDFSITDNQVRYPNFITRKVLDDKTLPGAGSFTPYKSTIFDVKNGYDFLQSQGMVGGQITKHIGVQVGHGRHFIGDGYRSLLLSDYANNYFFMRLNTRVWRLHYQNIFAQLKSSSVKANGPGQLLPRKYMAAHYLSMKLGKRVQIGLFENVIYSRATIEPEYLNPIILYRTVEEQLGSPDNVLLGINGRVDLFNHVSLYGALLLDEFNFRKLRDDITWWGNKFGVQAGVKYFDVLGVKGLYAQAEINLVRPYTYAHADSLRNYQHFRQSLAHPLGSNFVEQIAVLRYQPNAKWTMEARLVNANKGLDSDSVSRGGNILVPYTFRSSDTENRLLQGSLLQMKTATFDVSYALYHGLWVDLMVLYRNQTNARPIYQSKNLFFSIGFRMNMSIWRNDF